MGWDSGMENKKEREGKEMKSRAYGGRKENVYPTV